MNSVKKARKAAKLTQAKAAKLVGVTDRTWRNWESGQTTMPAAARELFQLKTGAMAPKERM